MNIRSIVIFVTVSFVICLSLFGQIKWKHIHARLTGLRSLFNYDSESVNSIVRKWAASHNYSAVVSSTGNPYFEKRYVVISMVKPDFRKTLSKDTGWQYTFYIPITVHAWWRHNISTIIVVTGVNVSDSIWTEHDLFKEMYRLIKDVPGVKFVYLESPSILQVTIAQSSRMFACFLLPEIPDDRILITSDIDLVPLSVNLYQNMQSDKVRILNAYCCGRFPHGGKEYTMYPMSNIAATVKVWRTVMDKHKVKAAADIIKALAIYYKIPNKIHKGDNDGWYMDQHVVSILLTESKVPLDLVERSMSTRINRIHGDNVWSNFTNFDTKVDAHMPLPPWQFPERVKNLVHELFKNNKTLIAELDRYTDMFHD